MPGQLFFYPDWNFRDCDMFGNFSSRPLNLQRNLRLRGSIWSYPHSLWLPGYFTRTGAISAWVFSEVSSHLFSFLPRFGVKAHPKAYSNPPLSFLLEYVKISPIFSQVLPGWVSTFITLHSFRNLFYLEDKTFFLWLISWNRWIIKLDL